MGLNMCNDNLNAIHQRPSHGVNMGSNPIGDTKLTFQYSRSFLVNHQRLRLITVDHGLSRLITIKTIDNIQNHIFHKCIGEKLVN